MTRQKRDDVEMRITSEDGQGSEFDQYADDFDSVSLTSNIHGQEAFFDLRDDFLEGTFLLRYLSDEY